MRRRASPGTHLRSLLAAFTAHEVMSTSPRPPICKLNKVQRYTTADGPSAAGQRQDIGFERCFCS